MCRSRHVLAACLCLVTLVATACSRGSAASGGDVVTVDGSSTVFPISEAVAEEFQMAQPGSRVTVGISGTGGGFQKFCRGETDISNASRPISATEQAAGVDQTGESMQEMSQSIRQNADNAKVTDGIASKAASEAWTSDGSW